MRSTLRYARFKAPTTQPFSPSPYLCLRCRSSLYPPLSRHYANNSPSSDPNNNSKSDDPSDRQAAFLQKARRRIWGTERPPGQRDPYQLLTPEERQREAQLKAEEQAESAQVQAEADVVREAEEEYVPATRGDDLERIGGPTGWWEEEWDRENVYQGFLTERKITHKEASATIRRVLVELLALQEAGRPSSEASQASTEDNDHVDYSGIDIVVSDAGHARLSYKDPALQTGLMEALEPLQFAEEIEEELGQVRDEAESEQSASNASSEDIRASAEAIPAETTSDTAEEMVKSRNIGQMLEEQKQAAQENPKDIVTATTQASDERAHSIERGLEDEDQLTEQDRAWYEVPLVDLDFKFAFIKRLMSLSGIRIHDPRINEFAKVGDVVAYLSEKPKPKKLVDILLEDSELMALPNVEIFERRHTPIDKEKEVGRWKLIEAELLKRGLPVTGHRVN